MSRSSLLAAVSLLLGSLLAVPAQAAISRTYVASYGDDANTAYSCDFAHPCRTFQTAFSQVTTGGEILAVDGSGYGTLVIDRSVAVIANPGIFAGIGVFSGGTGVSIATAGVSVTLRGLTLNGQGGGYGIRMTNGSRLSVENCVIANFSSSGQYGLRIETPAQVRVVQSLFRDNYRAASIEAGATASISRSEILGSIWTGISAYHLSGAAGVTTTVTVSDSIVANNGGGWGAVAHASIAGSYAKLHIVDSTITNASYGISAEAATSVATITLSGSLVTGNGTGLAQAGASVLRSFGNNTVTENTTSTSGVITAGVPM